MTIGSWSHHSTCLFISRVSLEIGVWIYDTFDDDFRIKNVFTKYLKESGGLRSD